MVHNGSIAHSVGAFDAVSICPRQQIHRPVKELSYELASHVSAYLDHQRFEQAYIFLHSLLAAGNSISVPAKPYVGLLAPPVQLALASTLVAYPPVTTKAVSTEAPKGSDAALRYLRCVHDTVRGPGYKTIRAAFTFSDSRRRPTLRSSSSSPSSPHVRDIDQLNDIAANSKSIWHCGEDFWHVVGWAFNCSVVQKKRWARWRLWLDVMLNFLETEWDDCIKNSDPHSVERQNLLQESLMWRYITSQEPLAGNTRKRIFKAILATGDPQSLKEFPEVWHQETAEVKQEDTSRKHTGPIDFNEGNIGDYESEDEDVEMQDAPQSTVKTRRSTRNAPGSSESPLLPLEDAFIPDYEAAMSRFGGMDSVDLRQRLIALLVKASRDLPEYFTPLEGLLDTLARQLQYYSVAALSVLITTSRMHPAQQLALNVTILTPLTSEKYINYTATTPTQQELEKYILPRRAKTYSFAANAKVSLILEQITLYMMDEELLQPTTSLRNCMVTGINERSSVRGNKSNPKEEEQGETFLMTSSERLCGLLELLEIGAGKTPT